MIDRFRLDFIANLKTRSKSELEQVRAVMAEDADTAREIASRFEREPQSEFFSRGTFAHFCRSTSAYCAGANVREWVGASSWATPDKATHRVTIVGQTRYKDEIDHFLTWVHPFVDAEEFDYLGSILYGGYEMPILLHYSADGIRQVHPTDFEDFWYELNESLY